MPRKLRALHKAFTNKTPVLAKKLSLMRDLIVLFEIEVRIASINRIVNLELHLLSQHRASLMKIGKAIFPQLIISIVLKQISYKTQVFVKVIF
jgi:hypothetical protein